MYETETRNAFLNVTSSDIANFLMRKSYLEAARHAASRLPDKKGFITERHAAFAHILKTAVDNGDIDDAQTVRNSYEKEIRFTDKKAFDDMVMALYTPDYIPGSAERSLGTRALLARIRPTWRSTLRSLARIR